MTLGCLDWRIDPLPVPPAPFGTTEYWRWWSAIVLAHKLGPISEVAL
jgi:hypothetical protein